MICQPAIESNWLFSPVRLRGMLIVDLMYYNYLNNLFQLYLAVSFIIMYRNNMYLNV